MADQVILLEQGDGRRASEILDAFGERTGLEAEEIEGGASFLIEGEQHKINIVQTSMRSLPTGPITSSSATPPDEHQVCRSFNGERRTRTADTSIFSRGAHRPTHRANRSETRKRSVGLGT